MINPSAGYPVGHDLYYECLRCGDVIPSLPFVLISQPA